MIGRTNAGGGGLNIKDYAISVTFPVGSECTCTDGVKVLKSKGALAGTWIFPVYPGTWTVTITDGEASRSETVVISDTNKSVYMNIGYNYYVVRNGVYQNGITWSGGSSESLTQGPPEFIIYDPNVNVTAISSDITVPSHAKNLHIEFSKLNVYYATTITFLGFSATSPSGSSTIGTPWTAVFPVDTAAGATGKISIAFRGVSSGDYHRHYITNIWFD